MTTIYLVRHAQAEGNLYRRCHSWHNGLLTQKGREQVKALERRFEGVPFDAVYSSDLYRTMSTAGAIYRPRGLTLRVDPQLREIGAGVWEDVPWGQLLHDHRDSLAAFLRCDPAWQVEGSETHVGVRRRVQAAIERIARAHPGQTVAVVSHGCAIRAGLSAWLGLGEDEIGRLPLPDNTGVAKLEVTDGRVSVVYYNDSSHLPPPPAPPLVGVAGMEKNALRFSPLPLPQQRARYLAALEDCGLALDGLEPDFQPSDGIVLALLGDTPVGLLHMDRAKGEALRTGWVSLLYVAPEFRSKRFGVQLLGHAVCTYRAMGRQFLRLVCPPEHERAEQFFLAQGFAPVDGRPGTLETYIGLEL